MKKRTILGETHDEERAFYNIVDAKVVSCTFAGEADGESALKECRNIEVENCNFSLRYPLWHVENFTVTKCKMDEFARAAVWYSKNGYFADCKLGGIKIFRECENIKVENCEIVSDECSWSCRGLEMADCHITSVYFLLNSCDIKLTRVKMDGKYPCQYIENAVLENCELTAKDVLWNCKNVTVRNSVISGEYLAWYSENLTFENCLIKGTQPLCYCKNLKLINCRMENCDLSFELSDVEATIIGNVDSIKNPLSGTIVCDSVGEVINIPTTKECHGKVIIRK